MKKITVIILIVLVVVSSKSFAACNPNYDRCSTDPAAQIIGTAIGQIAADAIFGRQHHSHRNHYRHNGGYYGDEYENARRAGYEEARRRHIEEMRWRQEEARRQRIENARMEGEMLYQQRHGGRRW